MDQTMLLDKCSLTRFGLFILFNVIQIITSKNLIVGKNTYN